jgi:hypothetical protein
MRFNGCRSIGWLKVSDNGDRIGRNTLQLRIKPSEAIAVPLFNHRELCAFRNSDRQLRQTPYELVEAGTHTIEGIPTSQTDVVGDIIKLNPEDMPLIFKVILTGKSAGLRLMENLKVRVESLKVTLCPIQLQIGVCQSSADHNLQGFSTA